MKDYPVANKSLIKDINTTAILQLVRSRGPISRAEIAKVTRLNPATVSSNVSNLIELGIVRELGAGESSGGRKPMLIELNPGAYHVIGVDMGTTDVSAGMTDLEGRIVHKVTLSFGGLRAPDAIIGVMKDAVAALIAESGVDKERLLGIGMGIHGLVNPEEGLSVYAPAFQWENVAIAEPFSTAFALPVVMDNDVRAMALGEKWFGKAVLMNNFVFVNLGTGVGSGIYVNGELIRGAHYGAGEIGHIRIVDEGEPCFCGKTGCLSTLASGPAIERRAKEALEAGAASLLSGRMKNNGGIITGEMIHAAALEGDSFALQLLEETGRYVGSALSLIVNLLNPEMILVGGGVSNAGDYLFQGMKREVAERSMSNNTANLYVGPAGLGDDCGIVGASTLILRNLFSNPNQYKEF